MPSQHRANVLVMSLTVISIGLVVALVILWQRAELAPKDMLAVALSNPELKQAVVNELVTQGSGVFDSHPDPDVAYILQPNLNRRQFGNEMLSTNQWGLREFAYEMPKREGTIRVVLLGDSYVHGNGVAMEDRCGVKLQDFLQKHALVPAAHIECLHLGMPSWNILAECAFVRRQLAALQPDLVIQIAVPNDLDDTEGVRGFGSMALFTPQHRERGSAVIRRTWPSLMGYEGFNYLLHALDFESQQRYEQARESIVGLRDALDSAGGAYLLVLNWMAMLPVGLAQFGAAFSSDELTMLPFALYKDSAYRISERDGHWNSAGHVHVAMALYHLIRSRDLLPTLKLAPWQEATQVWQEMADQVDEELDEAAADKNRFQPKLSSAIDFTVLTEETARLIYGGLYGEYLGPFASWVLGRRGGKHFAMEGTVLPAPSLSGAEVRLYLEGVAVDSFVCQPGEPFNLRVPLPTDLLDRNYINVRIESDDFAYGGEDFRTMVSLAITRAAIE